MRQASSFSLPQNEHMGRVIAIAVVLAILAHVVMIFGLKSMSVALPRLQQVLDIQTEPLVVRELEFRESLPEMETEELAEPPKVAGDLVDEIDILEEIPEDLEIDMSPEITDPVFDIEMETPALKGEELADSMEPLEAPEFTEDQPELGRTEDVFQIAAAGQVVIDPGGQAVEAFDSDQFNEELARKGASGLADEGALDSFSPLSAMTKMTGTALESTKGMIGSDLLFEFNQALLRDSARNSLLKVALLIDKNPGLNCWIEGHTDTIGGDLPNGELSLQRAQAVKDWLVKSMRIDPERLIVIGYGKRQPIVAEGDQEVQSINRRVVIKMRRGEPTETAGMFLEGGVVPSPVSELESAQVEPTPKVVLPEPTVPKPEAVEPILIKIKGPPNIPRAEPVVEDPPLGKAVIEEEDPPLAKAVIEEEEPPRRAVPVDPGRAVPVE